MQPWWSPILAVLLLLVVAAPAEAGPIRDLIGSVPTDLPTSGGTEGLEEEVDARYDALMATLHDALIGILEGAPESDEGVPGALLEYAEDWAERVDGQDDCVTPDVVYNGSQPAVPPKVSSGEGEGYRWYRVHTGAVIISIQVDGNCVGGFSQPQSQSTPWP